ncbi:hypothetical protein [Methylobacterium sp. A54F]
MFVEQRKARRHTVTRLGVVQIDFCSPDIECLIWDLSTSGALIQPLQARAIPREFELWPGTDTDRRSCRVVWARAGLFGVTFIA